MVEKRQKFAAAQRGRNWEKFAIFIIIKWVVSWVHILRQELWSLYGAHGGREMKRFIHVRYFFPLHTCRECSTRNECTSLKDKHTRSWNVELRRWGELWTWTLLQYGAARTKLMHETYCSLRVRLSIWCINFQSIAFQRRVALGIRNGLLNQHH